MDPIKNAGDTAQPPANDQNPLTGGSNPPLGGLNPESPSPVSNDLGGSVQSNPLSPEVPQPLNVSPAQTPTEMPPGDPISPVGNKEDGLPASLPNSQTHSGGSRKMMVGIIIVLVLAILGVGGYYFYTMQMSAPAEETSNQTTNQTENDLTELESEAENIQVTDSAGDMMAIDEEINLLEATPSSSKSPLSR